jgi:hypothetical protein
VALVFTAALCEASGLQVLVRAAALACPGTGEPDRRLEGEALTMGEITIEVGS